ncbi:MAG: hypothetical protein WCI04_02760 [archaeon]
MTENTGFRLVSKSEIARLKAVPFISNPLTEAIGIAKGSELVAFFMRTRMPKSSEPELFNVWTTNKTNLLKEFRRTLEVTPAEYLAEHFIRKGEKITRTEIETASSKRFALRLAKKGLVNRETPLSGFKSIKYEATPKWIGLARSRKRLLK